jgi:catechol 2,3-dioxygenase-like lactoylglutathione lyase family enzyme
VAARRLATSHRASRNHSGVAAESSDICRARRDSPGSRSTSGARHADAADAKSVGPYLKSSAHHAYTAGVQIDLVALIVDEYDPAIAFFTGILEFELVEDSPSLTNDGRPKRWVVVRPPGAQTGLLLARADGERQSTAVGDQAAGRVGFFLHVDDFDAAYRRMTKGGVTFVREPRTEPYGRVAVFLDIAGNRWDLLGDPQGEEGSADDPQAH